MKRFGRSMWVCLFLVSLGWSQGSIAPQEALRLLGRAAAEVEVKATRVVNLPNLGVSVTEVKAIDRATGDAIAVAVDDRGRSVDMSEMLRREREARMGNPLAKLHPDLAGRFQETAEGDQVAVIFWLHFDVADLDAKAREVFRGVDHENVDEDLLRAMEAEVGAYVQERNAHVTGPFVAHLESVGIGVRNVSASTPAVFLDATRAAVIALAADPRVDTVYLDEVAGGWSNEDANATHRTTRVHQQGVRGRGIRFTNLGGLDLNNPWLQPVAWYQPGLAPSGGHGTQVCGCAASTHPDRLGASPDVALYAANITSLSNTSITNAGSWIASQNIDVTNMSYYVNTSTLMQYQDRYFDYQVRFLQDSYVTAAGNEGNNSGNVVSPSKGWNVLTVGNHTDGGNGNWSGDVMNGSSSFNNPSTGCEKPNVAANGTGLYTIDLVTNGGVTAGGVTGTSYASPHTAGNLCNAMVVNSAIRVSPEAANALMMATAWHNIEGASRLSSRDGAGGIHGLGAFRAAKENRVVYRTLTGSSFNNAGYYTETITLTGGDRARICIAWSSDASSSYATDVLDADLDLAVMQGANATSGPSYGSSSSFNNSFEIVEFTPPTTGQYTIRINDWRFDGTSERVGIAWSQKYRDTSSFKIREVADNTFFNTTGPTIGNTAYATRIDAPDSPNAGYVWAPSATAPYFGGPGVAYSAHNWQPLTHDALTDLWFAGLGAAGGIWSNTTGNLNSSGQSGNIYANIANVPSLVGFDAWHVGFTIEAGYPDTIKQISEIFPVKLWPQGINKPRSNDGSFVQQLPAGFGFYGQNYTQCHVNMNGNITFGAPSSDPTESVADMQTGQPRIAFLWDDLNPAALAFPITSGPRVRVREILTGPADKQRVIIEFVNVPQNGISGGSTVRVTLHGYTGAIEIEYLDCNVPDCIVGISPGAGISSAPSIDISRSGHLKGAPFQALFQHFPGCVGFSCNTMDLDSPNSTFWNRVKFTPTNLFTFNEYRLEIDLQ